MRSTLSLNRRAVRQRALHPALILAAALSIALASYAWVAIVGREPAPGPVASAAAVRLPVPVADPLQPLTEIDRAIRIWTGNLERNKSDFIAALNLSELYLGRSRLSADPADIDRALDAAARALKANPQLVGASLLHAQAQLARHDFSGAETAATVILDAHPGYAPALATRGDALLEMGQYQEAQAAYASLGSPSSSAAVAARLARVESLTGDLAGGRRLAADAVRQASGDPDARPTDLAWYHTLAGSLAFQAGDLPAAAKEYHAALGAWPASAAALAGLGRTRAAQGDVQSAIGLYQQSVAIVPLPDPLASLGDLLTMKGRTDEAAAVYAQVRAIGQLASAVGVYDRQFALFLANHGEDPQRAVEIAAADLKRRSDVYAHDAYAWALYAAGRYAEADDAVRAARAQGTEDALLDYHAGMIANALGRQTEARQLLRSALERNAGFDVLQARAALTALAGLDAARP
jgi:tetratricopeptide (TPR) repeat protein